MLEKNITPGTLCFLKGNHTGNKTVDLLIDAGSRQVTAVEEGDYDEDWGSTWKIQTVRGEVTVFEQDLSPIPNLEPGTTSRGFGRREFEDMYGSTCSIQDSSLATDDCIWLGVNNGEHFECKPPYDTHPDAKSNGGRMHLSRGQVAALLPLLQHFVRHGTLPGEGG